MEQVTCSCWEELLRAEAVTRHIWAPWSPSKSLASGNKRQPYVLFFQAMCDQLLSRVQLSAPPSTAARQAPVSVGFPRQEYWRGLQFPTPRDLPNPEIEPQSLVPSALASGFFTTVPPMARPFATHRNDFPLRETEKCRKGLDHRWKPSAAWKNTTDKTDINKNRDVKNELCIFIKKTDDMHDKYSLCLKDLNLFFFKNDFFPLSFRMHLPHLPTPVLNLNCTVSSERTQDHGLSWGGTEVLWSVIGVVSGHGSLHVPGPVPVTLMSLKLTQRDGLPVTAPLRDRHSPGPVT